MTGEHTRPSYFAKVHVLFRGHRQIEEEVLPSDWIRQLLIVAINVQSTFLASRAVPIRVSHLDQCNMDLQQALRDWNSRGIEVISILIIPHDSSSRRLSLTTNVD